MEIGLKLTPLSPPEAFVDLLFQKKTDAGMYGPANSQKTFVLKVMKHTGTTADGVNTFDAKYMKVLNGRACRGEVEPFNQGELLEHLLDESGQRERLMATKAGELLERLTRYSYIKTLAFWVDLTAQGKIVSKIFQRSGLLLSDVSSGVEDAVAAIAKLKKEPGIFMKGLDKDFDATHQTLHGRELSGIADGEEAYDAMVENVTNSVVEHMNERFYTILSDPVFKAGCKFEHMRWPSFGTDRLALESHGEQEIELLLGHYKTLYSYLGGDPAKARCEWRRLKLYVGREATLISLSYFELYERLFNQKGNKFLYGADGTCSDKLDELSFYNILLLVAIIMSYAVDTSICERGFALMNNLKTARRSRMGGLLLRTLMIICELGKEWADPTKIPVEEIVAEWREQSARGRYEGAMWRAAGLEEPTPAAAAGTAGAGAEDGAGADADVEVDNLAAGGFFGWMGREQRGAGTVLARAFRPPTPPAAAERA